MTQDGHQSPLQSRKTSCPERSTRMVTRIVLQIRICAFEIRRRVFASSLQTFHRVNRQTLFFSFFFSSLFLSPLLSFITRRRARIFQQRKKKRIKWEAKKRNEERRWPKELPFILSIDSFIWFIAHYRRVLARYYANKAITESACTYVEPCST